jgi:uncharacterized repeat protein (TIGR01451 family)
VILDVDDPLPAGAEEVINQAQLMAPSLLAPIEVEDADDIATRPDLTLSEVHQPSLFSPGGLMTYTLTYGNAGHMHAQDVVITTTLPADTTYEGYGWTPSGQRGYTYTLGSLSAGDTDNTITLTLRYTDPVHINTSGFDIPFRITQLGSGSGDANPPDNNADAYVGVPDLVVVDFDVEPLPLDPDMPVTFTVRLRNQGTGWAYNPVNQSGFCVDVFGSTVASYGWDRYSDIDVWDYAPPLAPGAEHTLTLTRGGLSVQELTQIEEFYVRVDNHEEHAYGLVPESNEMNNVAGPISPWLHTIYLPLVLRGQR